MHFHNLILPGAYLLTFEPKEDVRGSFCRLFCSDLLRSHGIEDSHFVQVNLSTNKEAHTLRGMHYQELYPEAKLVYCLKGKIFDALIDLRPDSPTFLKSCSIELSGKLPQALYIPKGCAHGYLTLQKNTELLYLMSEAYKPGNDKGYLWNDPTFAIPWPFKPKCISERDQSYPHYEI